MTLEDLVAPFVRQLTFDASKGLRWLGTRQWVAPAAAAETLAEWLYQRLFIDWTPSTGRFANDTAGAPWYVEQLSARTAGVAMFEDGFVLSQVSAQGRFVVSDAIRLFVEDPRAVRPRNARVGQKVAVQVPCARESAVAGFFTVVSREGRIFDGAHLKLYLNLSPAGALDLVEALLHDPALATARFEAKVVNDPDAFGRRDTALVYVWPPSWAAVTRWVRTFHRRHRRQFRAGTPPMTLPLGLGLSAAEAESGDESFGAHRCRLLATGILQAFQTKTSLHHAFAAVFRKDGVDVYQPWVGTWLPSSWIQIALDQ